MPLQSGDSYNQRASSVGAGNFERSHIMYHHHLYLLEFLNQERAEHRLARAWFLKIASVMNVCMRVCVCVCACMCVSTPRLLITSVVI